LAPTYSAQFALATNENGVVITSSPSLIPAATIAQCSPAVPDDTAIACRRSVSLAHMFSNSTTFGPIESVSVCSTSTTASISRCVMSGLDRGMVAWAAAMCCDSLRVYRRIVESLYCGVPKVR
jgi:hypothetical protein